MAGFGLFSGTREQYTPEEGKLNISMDFNAAARGTARGTEVIVPDNASPEVRAAAERYNQMVANFARRHGIEDYPVRGVKTRSENQRGVPFTVHTEPFFNTDLDMQRAILANPEEFASIYTTAFGGLPEARIIAPHGVGKDRGATSEIFGDETSFGEYLASAAGAGQATPEARHRQYALGDRGPGTTGQVLDAVRRGDMTESEAGKYVSEELLEGVKGGSAYDILKGDKDEASFLDRLGDAAAYMDFAQLMAAPEQPDWPSMPRGIRKGDPNTGSRALQRMGIASLA